MFNKVSGFRFWFSERFHSPAMLSDGASLCLAQVQGLLEAPKYVNPIYVCGRKRTGEIRYLVELRSPEFPEQNVQYVPMNY